MDIFLIVAFCVKILNLIITTRIWMICSSHFFDLNSFDKKLISWQFETLKKLGVIEQGSHPVGWCPNDSNPVSQHDTLGDVEPACTLFDIPSIGVPV